MARRLSFAGLVLLIAAALADSALLASDQGGPPGSGPDGQGWKSRLPKPLEDRDYYDNGRPDPVAVELGRLLFFDKILSGNKNISCGTCHHPLASTGDDLSLPVGEGGSGLGKKRDTGSGDDAIHERMPRNAPPIFNLGVKRFRVMFHDGRLRPDKSQPSGFDSPAGDDLPSGLENVLAALAMFPVTVPTEMAGQAGENAVADAAAADNLPRLWQLLARRLRAIPLYVELFREAYPESVRVASDVTYVHAANAMATFMAKEWRSDGSPFDRYLRGETDAMSPAARKGMRLFYGKFDCVECHSGKNLTDLKFHAMAMPQIGPGKGHGESGFEDWGRGGVTGRESDRFAFRTPPLRNVALTGPWGHAGAYSKLRSIVRHMLEPVESLEAYGGQQAVLPSRPDLDAIDFLVHDDPVLRAAIAEACERPSAPGQASPKQVDHLVAFLRSLTDPRMVDLRRDIPDAVPSGLPVAD